MIRHIVIITTKKAALTRIVVNELDPRLNYGESEHRLDESVQGRTFANDSVAVCNGCLELGCRKTIEFLENVRHIRLVSEHEDVVFCERMIRFVT